MKCSIILVFLVFSHSFNAQNLRKFGVFFGGFVPDLSINAGVNYKLTDFIEIEAQYSNYILGLNALNFGSKYLYHLGEKTEKFPVNSITLGLSYEWRGSKNFPFESISDSSVFGNYHVQKCEYLNLSFGFRTYENFEEEGKFVKELYIMPVLTYFIPINGTYTLTEGIPDLDLEKRISKITSGGFNVMVRVGIVF